MQNPAAQDINYQPQTQGFSYTKSNNSSNSNNKTNIIFTIIILVVFVISLAVAGIFYINRQSVNNLVKNTINTQKLNFTKLSYQASQSQMLEYVAKVTSKNIPQNNHLYKNEVNGIFSGFDDKNLQIVSYNGIQNFAISQNLTIFEYVVSSGSAQTEEILTALPIRKEAFFNKTGFGKILLVVLATNPSNLITKIYFNE